MPKALSKDNKRGPLYAIIDLETTGGMSYRDKITEIAIVLFDGEKVIDSYETLINPERSIPYEITRITGITNEMVAQAPKFYQVAKKIVEMTEEAIFVAHNVRFDYSFMKEEFGALGYTFTRKQLCTVVLCRKSFPGLTSYSLGNLIRHFGINVQNRHRAMDDALATVNLLQRVLTTDEGVFRTKSLIKDGIIATHLPQNITDEFLKSIPEVTGVYYFYNTYDTVIYVGKSINIRKRIMQHFGNIDGKTDKFIRKVARITYTPTGSELIAMLLESHEIKTLSPEINKAQRAKDYPYFIHHFEDSDGFVRFSWEKSSTKSRINKKILNFYSSKHIARGHLHHITESFQLCGCKTGINDPQTACFDFQTGRCSHAIYSDETVTDYNLRALEGAEILKKSFENDFFIITEGREAHEKGIVMVADGQYKGFGFLNGEENLSDPNILTECIQPQLSTPETHQIIETGLVKNQNYKIIPHKTHF